MASNTLVPVEEYLKMSFDGPEPDYVDGEIKERSLGSIQHFEVQERLLEYFRSLRKSKLLFGYPEVTLRITGTRYRVADVAVFHGGRPTGERYPSNPPVIVVEIVSEDDRHIDIQKKLAEYHALGVKHVWLADPWTNKLSVYDAAGWHAVTALESAEFGVKLSADAVFAE